jgi:hypothetical protein
MLQASEIQKRFSHLQQTISEASRACHSGQSIPQDLVDCVEQLDKQCKSAKSVMSSQDQGRMRQCVDDLESMGDRAKRACQSAGGLDANVKQAVTSLHSELSELKRQMH